MLMNQQLEAISIADRIRSLMGTETEVAFAHRLRIAPHCVAVCLKGRVPDPRTLARISEVCQVSLDWLLRGSPDGDIRPTPPDDKALDAATRSVPPPASLVVNHAALAGVRDFVSNPLLVEIAREQIQQWIRQGTKGKDAVPEIASR